MSDVPMASSVPYVGPERIEFAVPGEPQQQGSEHIVYSGEWCPRCRTKPFAKITTDNPRLARWRQDIGVVATRAMRGTRPWKYAASIEFVFVLTPPQRLPKERLGEPITFPDLDKLVRGAIDAMTGIVWEDDKQVTKIGASKRYRADAQEQPGVIIRAAPLHPDREAIEQASLFGEPSHAGA